MQGALEHCASLFSMLSERRQVNDLPYRRADMEIIRARCSKYAMRINT